MSAKKVFQDPQDYFAAAQWGAAPIHFVKIDKNGVSVEPDVEGVRVTEEKGITFRSRSGKTIHVDRGGILARAEDGTYFGIPLQKLKAEYAYFSEEGKKIVSLDKPAAEQKDALRKHVAYQEGLIAYDYRKAVTMSDVLQYDQHLREEERRAADKEYGSLGLGMIHGQRLDEIAQRPVVFPPNLGEPGYEKFVLPLAEKNPEIADIHARFLANRATAKSYLADIEFVRKACGADPRCKEGMDLSGANRTTKQGAVPVASRQKAEEPIKS